MSTNGTTRRSGIGANGVKRISARVKMALAGLAIVAAAAVGAAEPSVRTIRPDLANEVKFEPVPARFVRFLVHASSQNQACLDELEIYGPGSTCNLATADEGGKPSASSCLSGYPQHTIEHLNDGQYGNSQSWIAATQEDEWAQIELRQESTVSRIVFSRDRTGQFSDRVPIDFEVSVSRDGVNWKTVAHVVGKAAPSMGQHGNGVAGYIPPPPLPPARTGKSAPASVTKLSQDRARDRDNLGYPNLALDAAARPHASSVLPGFAFHQIEHLNDGLVGNQNSWISAADPSWAEIDLGQEYWVYHVAFGNDSLGEYRDRAAVAFSIQTATDDRAETQAPRWNTVYEQESGTPVFARRSFTFLPVRARWVRVSIHATNGDTARIDELEVFGSAVPIPPERIGRVGAPDVVTRGPAFEGDALDEAMQTAILAEEHAWLKTFGHADLSDRLVPYNGRVKEYPHHAPADLLPLTALDELPTLDGRLDDACWQQVSRGVARVASPYDYQRGPLIEAAVSAGYRDNQLLLAIRMNDLLSGHLAVISRGDGQFPGVLVVTETGLRWNTYAPDGQLQNSAEVVAASDASWRAFEVQLPLDRFPEWETYGLRVGLGMGGQHTGVAGQAVHFVAAPLGITEVTPCRDRIFQVRLSAARSGSSLRIAGNTPEIANGLTLAPGTSQLIRIPADGPIGPEFQLEVSDDRGGSYRLRLLRYDPVGRTLALMEQMADRLEQKGLDVQEERQELADLRRRHLGLLAGPDQRGVERQLLLAAHAAKRRLFFRDPDLRPLQQVLFVKRHAFEPSHNYSVLLDAPYRPGGGVYLLSLPWRDGRCEPSEATLTRLFEAGDGIARNPMANFDLSKIYFGYRPSQEGYFHILEMEPDGSRHRQLTDGPFHDYWPCPLPDGGLAFISTRCRARFLCWRPQAAVLFRMDGDGQNIRPLSFANLTEWGPSVMSDGRIIWQRSEYLDKGADFSHTLWAIRPDGTHPELIFGNDIIQPNGYANGREVPGTSEFLCTLVSHFGDLNGPLALVDPAEGKFNPRAITSLTPEVPWPGMWPREECFRDGYPLARDYFLCSHAPRDQFGLYVIDRFGNRELLYLDPKIGSMCPTLFRAQPSPPILPSEVDLAADDGEFFLADVYAGLEGFVQPGSVKYLRVCQELRANLEQLPDGSYQQDHPPFEDFYATPTHKIQGPFGWPSYVAKASLGIVPVEADGSVRFRAPAGQVLYFEVLDEHLNELQRMRSVVQLQPGEKRSCIGCHESRSSTPRFERALALKQPPRPLEPPSWGAVPFSYQEVVQPVWDRHCVRCHDANDEHKLDFTATLDGEKIPASYRTLISQGWVHYLDFGWNSGGNEKRDPLTFGTVKSKLFGVLDAPHYDVQLTRDDMHRIKCWIDLNCPLWPDYRFRGDRPAGVAKQ